MFPKLEKLNGAPDTFINQLKSRDSELLSYISNRVYEGYNYEIIKSNLDIVLGSRFSKNNVSKDEIDWLNNTYIDAININDYQNINGI